MAVSLASFATVVDNFIIRTVCGADAFVTMTNEIMDSGASFQACVLIVTMSFAYGVVLSSQVE